METNRDTFWYYYVECKYNEWFCRHLKDEARLWNTVILYSCSLASLGSVSAWGIWAVVPMLWAIILMVMQAIQAFRPYFPYFDRLTAFKYFLPQLSDLLIDMEDDWLRMDSYSREQIADLILKYKKRYKNLDCTYLESINIPISGRTYERISSKAAQQCLRFFAQKYNAGGEIIGTSTEAKSATTTSSRSATGPDAEAKRSATF